MPSRLIEQYQQTNLARSLADFPQHGQVGLLFPLASDDQIAVPGLDAKRRAVGVLVQSDGQLKVRLCRPA